MLQRPVLMDVNGNLIHYSTSKATKETSNELEANLFVCTLADVIRLY